MPTSSASSRSSSWPDRPTNGSPRRSSSRPGASPTNMRSASGSPTPNTTWVRVAASGHRVHPAASAASSASRVPGAIGGIVSSGPRPRLRSGPCAGLGGQPRRAASSTRATRSGRSPATRPVGMAERAGPAVDVRAQGGGLERGHPPGQERADDTGQHVAGAGGGQRRGAGRGQQHPSRRVGHRRRRPLQQHDGARQLRPGAGRRPPGPARAGCRRRRSYSPSWGVSTTGRRGLERPAVEAPEHAQPVGVDHHRARPTGPPATAPVRPVPLARPESGAHHHGTAPCRRPPGRRRPSPSPGRLDPDGLGGRQVGEGRRRARRGGPSRPGPVGGGCAQRRRHRSCPASRRPPARRPPTCCRRGPGPAARRRRRRPPPGRSGRPPTGRPMSATRTVPASRGAVALDQAGLAGGEGDGRRGGQHAAAGRAGVAGHPRGDVHGQHRHAGGHPGRVVGAAEAGAEGGVDHQVDRRARRRRWPRPRRGRPRSPGRPAGPAVRPATRPSAPLLPLPQITTTRRP